MLKSEIFYFSGSGNSYAVARDIADELNAKLLPIIPLVKQDTIKSDSRVIGIVFPIYDFKAPEIVNSFIKKLTNLESRYIFAVCTYGVMPLKTMKKLNKTLNLFNGNLSGGFTVKMPHNGLGYNKISEVKQKKMFTKWNQKNKIIINYVKKQKQGTLECTGGFGYIVLLGIFIRMIPKLIPMLGRALIKGWDSLGFYFDENCNSCGICEKVCPVDNIKMIKDKPIWGDNCLSCFACIHWCPQESIQIANLTKKMNRYHHPDITLKDIINQKKHT